MIGVPCRSPEAARDRYRDADRDRDRDRGGRLVRSLPSPLASCPLHQGSSLDRTQRLWTLEGGGCGDRGDDVQWRAGGVRYDGGRRGAREAGEGPRRPAALVTVPAGNEDFQMDTTRCRHVHRYAMRMKEVRSHRLPCPCRCSHCRLQLHAMRSCLFLTYFLPATHLMRFLNCCAGRCIRKRRKRQEAPQSDTVVRRVS